MNDLLENLRTNLHEQVSLHERLMQHLAREAEQDGDMNAGTLVGVQIKKKECTEHIQRLESQRIQLIQSLAEAWGEPAEDLTLRRVIAKVDRELGEELRDCHGNLRKFVTEIRRLAKVTAANAHARLVAVEATLAVIHEAIQQHPIYSDEGRVKNKPPTFKYTSA